MARGYGFVSSLDADYFFHHSSIVGDGYKALADAQEIEFEVETNLSTGKLAAVKVTGPDGAPLPASDRPPPGRIKGKGKPWNPGEDGEKQEGEPCVGSRIAKGQRGGRRSPRPNSVFVAALSWETDSEGLRRHFEQAGEVVDASVVLDRDTGKSRGFGKVALATPDQVRTALEMLHGSELDGRAIVVREDVTPLGAPPQLGSSGPKAQGRGAVAAARGPRPNSLFVAGLSWGTTSEGLKHHFEQVGQVLDAHVALDRESGKSRGFGKVAFASPDQMREALATLHESELDGRAIAVREDNPPPPRVSEAAQQLSTEAAGSAAPRAVADPEPSSLPQPAAASGGAGEEGCGGHAGEGAEEDSAAATAAAEPAEPHRAGRQTGDWEGDWIPHSWSGGGWNGSGWNNPGT